MSFERRLVICFITANILTGAPFLFPDTSKWAPVKQETPKVQIPFDVEQTFPMVSIREPIHGDLHVMCMVPEEEQSSWRDELVAKACALDGCGTYHWNNKPDEQLYQAMMDYFEEGIETNGAEKEDVADLPELSLDCSGFVQLMYWIQTGEYKGELSSTYLIHEGCTPITKEELQPGDLGMIYDDGSYYILGDETKCYEWSSVENWLAEDDSRTKEDVIQYANHVGIYVGTTEDGTLLWAHCNSKTNGVVVDDFGSFAYYYRVQE